MLPPLGGGRGSSPPTTVVVLWAMKRSLSRMRVKVHPSLACLHDTICFTARPVDGVSAVSLPTDEQVCDACTIPDSEAG